MKNEIRVHFKKFNIESRKKISVKNTEIFKMKFIVILHFFLLIIMTV